MTESPRPSGGRRSITLSPFQGCNLLERSQRTKQPTIGHHDPNSRTTDGRCGSGPGLALDCRGPSPPKPLRRPLKPLRKVFIASVSSIVSARFILSRCKPSTTSQRTKQPTIRHPNARTTNGYGSGPTTGLSGPEPTQAVRRPSQAFFPELEESARPAAARPVSRVGGCRASAVRTGRRDIDRRKPKISVHDRSCRG